MFNRRISWLTHDSVMIATKAQAAARSAIPEAIRPQIVASAKQPPIGDEWLHEIKYDGYRLLAMVPGREQLKLISRNGFDRTPLFRAPFRKLAASGRRPPRRGLGLPLQEPGEPQQGMACRPLRRCRAVAGLGKGSLSPLQARVFL
jgi:hypothetical protein